jgi:hypothetical protein
VENVNISNTTVINKTYVTNVYNNVYVNKTVNVTNIKYQNQASPNAVTATSHETFTSAQSVGRHLVRVDAKEVASAPVAPLTPSVAPQQRSVLGAGTPSAAKPPATFQSRAVVAKTTPPPPPASFQRQQQAINANGGRPIAISEARQLQTERTQTPAATVKIAPPAKPATPQNIQTNRSGGNMQTNTGNRSGAPTNTVQPPANTGNRPGATTNAPAVNQGNRPGNPPPNVVNQRTYNDRPPSVRPNPTPQVDPRFEQKQQQQHEQLRQKQDQERQRIEQRQVQEQQRIQQKNADEARRQQIQQRQQQQLEQLERKHGQEQQKLQQKQQQEQQKQQQKQQQQQQKQQQSKPSKDDRSQHPKS